MIDLKRIISGGQTGVDRGALDVAIELGLDIGGCCPRGKIAEDGVIPPYYSKHLTEHSSSSDYSVRTEQNVMNSDGTLIFFRHHVGSGAVPPSEAAQSCGIHAGREREKSNVRVLFGGTAYTEQMARKHSKPIFLWDLTTLKTTRYHDGGDLRVDATAGSNLARVRLWLQTNEIAILNCAGPRESDCPGIHEETFHALREILKPTL